MENLYAWLLPLVPLLAIVAFVAGAFMVYRGLKLLADSIPDEDGIGLHEYVDAAVLAVDQMFKDNDGKFKLDKATEVVLKVFPDADSAQVRVFIEAAVKLLRVNESAPTPAAMPMSKRVS